MLKMEDITSTFLIDNIIFPSDRFADVKAKIASKIINKTIVCSSIRYFC